MTSAGREPAGGGGGKHAVRGRGRKPRPLVSLGLPVYNGENYLAAALGSLVGQDYPELQIIVADNASDDGTERIARDFAERDQRVVYLPSAENRGAAWNYNRTVDAADGDLFKWAAHDDVCVPSYVRRCVDALEVAGEAAVLAYPKTLVIDADGAVVGDFEDDMDLRETSPHRRLAHLLSVRTDYHPVFGLIRAGALRQSRRIGAYPGSDVVLLTELAIMGQFVEVPERLFLRRIHEKTSMNANPNPQDRAAWFDPRLAGRPALPLTQMTVQIAETIRRAELETTERFYCLAALSRFWARPYARHMAGEMRAVVEGRVRTARSR
jgi:glycosyltransferase involved in cell wall biosynthesis